VTDVNDVFVSWIVDGERFVVGRRFVGKNGTDDRMYET
jgi:hypothetical protein